MDTIIAAKLEAGPRLGLKLEDIGGHIEVVVVAPGGQAELAGVRVGDRVVGFGDPQADTMGRSAAEAFEGIFASPRPTELRISRAHAAASTSKALDPASAADSRGPAGAMGSLRPSDEAAGDDDYIEPPAQSCRDGLPFKVGMIICSSLILVLPFASSASCLTYFSTPRFRFSSVACGFSAYATRICEDPAFSRARGASASRTCTDYRLDGYVVDGTQNFCALPGVNPAGERLYGYTPCTVARFGFSLSTTMAIEALAYTTLVLSTFVAALHASKMIGARKASVVLCYATFMCLCGLIVLFASATNYTKLENLRFDGAFYTAFAGIVLTAVAGKSSHGRLRRAQAAEAEAARTTVQLQSENLQLRGGSGTTHMV